MRTVTINGVEYEPRLDADLSAAEVEKMLDDMQSTGCLFPDSHCPDHGTDYKFSVLFWQQPNAEWQELTEAEMLRQMEEQGVLHFLHTSDWDFWCEDKHERKHYE